MIYKSNDRSTAVKDILRFILLAVLIIFTVWDGAITISNCEMAIKFIKIDDVRLTIACVFFFTSILVKLYGVVISILVFIMPMNESLNVFVKIQIVTGLYNLIGTCYILILLIGTLVSLPLIGISIGPISYTAMIILTYFLRKLNQEPEWVALPQRDSFYKYD